MYTYQAQVTRVVDGDTIDALVDLGFDIQKSIRIRLVGMNAPESRTRDLEEKKLGLAAKARLIEILQSNENKLTGVKVKSVKILAQTINTRTASIPLRYSAFNLVPMLAPI